MGSVRSAPSAAISVSINRSSIFNNDRLGITQQRRR
jgi:hypothetical protein